MISETYPNHAAMMTGVDGTVNGIPSNTIWDGSRFRDLGATDLTAETVFDTVEGNRPEIHTAIAVDDPRIDELFAAEPYDSRWDPRDATLKLPIAGYPLPPPTRAAGPGRHGLAGRCARWNSPPRETRCHA